MLWNSPKPWCNLKSNSIMAKIDGVTIKEPWESDLIFPILKDAFSALLSSYEILYAERLKSPYIKPITAKKWQLEDIITDDLIKDEENLPKSFPYRIVNQQKDANKNTRIDIAIQWSLIFGHSYDIKIECKLLNKSNVNYIINGGFKKFKSNLYSEKLSISGMLFYNTKKSIEENISSLNVKIESILTYQDKLEKHNLIDRYENTYVSNHSRISNSDITIYSLVFDFSSVILN